MKMLLAGLILLVTFPPLVGSAAATIATAPHLTPAVRLFPWVPAGGYPDRFPYRVIYEVLEEENTVVVAAVLHAARDNRHWRRRIKDQG